MTAQATPTTLSLVECRRLIDSGQRLDILDVRTPAEFARVHAVGAWLMPLDQLDAAVVSARRTGRNDPVYVICQSGARAGKACQQLIKAGLSPVHSIEGGTAAWEQAGLPVERGQSKVISLERQVRIAAGSLVLVGIILAWAVHPAFMLLSGFVGAGLVFSGITDFCGMAILLGKMPWNRRGTSEVTK
ncbi:MAG TPA: rhodanese-like domain-containing protein [Tepidisphaeraceae bacterium]|jgi:rhodanese-related sulfurtransferase